jgi:hypothetical protein
MAWIELTESDIEVRLAANELSAWDSAGQEENNVVSRIPGIIKQTTGLIRGRVASCVNNVLNTDTCLIPEELLWAAATIAKNMVLASIPSAGQEASEERRDENRRAYDMLDQAASCELLIADDSGQTSNQESPEFGGCVLLDFSQ